jgi:hypothetical protein
MIRLAIGRALLWFIEPVEAERDQPIRHRSIARRQAYEEKARRERPERETITAAFHEADRRLQAQLAQGRLANSRSAANNLV